MTDIDKFFSDSDRILKTASKPGISGTSSSKTLARDLLRNFHAWTRNYGTLADALSDYWTQTYANDLDTFESRKIAAQWLGYALSLLSESFTPEMDFTNADWEAIREIVSSEADDIDISLLTSILSVIVERVEF